MQNLPCQCPNCHSGATVFCYTVNVQRNWPSWQCVTSSNDGGQSQETVRGSHGPGKTLNLKFCSPPWKIPEFWSWVSQIKLWQLKHNSLFVALFSWIHKLSEFPPRSSWHNGSPFPIGQSKGQNWQTGTRHYFAHAHRVETRQPQNPTSMETLKFCKIHLLTLVSDDNQYHNWLSHRNLWYVKLQYKTDRWRWKSPVIAQLTTEKRWQDQWFICIQVKNIWSVWPLSLPGLQNCDH